MADQTLPVSIMEPSLLPMKLCLATLLSCSQEARFRGFIEIWPCIFGVIAPTYEDPDLGMKMMGNLALIFFGIKKKKKKKKRVLGITSVLQFLFFFFSSFFCSWIFDN